MPNDAYSIRRAPRWRSVLIALTNFLLGALLLGASAHTAGVTSVLLFLAGGLNYGLGLYRINDWFGREWRLFGVS